MNNKEHEISPNQRLYALRHAAKKTQAAVAAILGCQREVYRRYEKGIHDIPAWAVIRLAKYYQTSADYILGLTEIPIPYRQENEDLG